MKTIEFCESGLVEWQNRAHAVLARLGGHAWWPVLARRDRLQQKQTSSHKYIGSGSVTGYTQHKSCLEHNNWPYKCQKVFGCFWAVQEGMPYVIQMVSKWAQPLRKGMP